MVVSAPEYRFPCYRNLGFLRQEYPRAEARIIEIACSPAPEGHSRWTLRLLEEQAKIVLDVPVSKDTIGRA